MKIVKTFIHHFKGFSIRLLRQMMLGIFVMVLMFANVPSAVAGQPAQEEDPCADPSNPIVAENCLPGSYDWIVTNYLDDIEGFAYPPSVNKGESVDLFVNTNAVQFDIDLYRSGYYGGTGGRLIATFDDVTGTDQPECRHDLYSTGLTSCSNWSVSHTIETGKGWVSGIYIAKLTHSATGGENYIMFTVRDDTRDSQVLYQQSLFTYHAYNNYAGKSVYDFNSGRCTTETNNPRAAKVSLYRPFYGVMELYSNWGNNYFRPEYPMVRWLEQQGYDVSYSTNLDTHRSGLPDTHNELLDHQVFLSVGHDEYWTQEIDDAVTEARDAGVHIGFFSANTGYWRVRLEPDPWTNEPDSVIVTYKTTESGPEDPSGHPTGTFRDPLGVDDPENNLIGIQYFGDNDYLFFPLRVSAEYGENDIYRHTDLQTMPKGTYIEIGSETFGWEWDAVADNGRTPEGLTILAETPVYGFLLRDAGESDNATSGPAVAHTTRYTAPSGAIVFAAGTIQWAWGLGARGTKVIETDPYIQQITYNILADMGIQPATPVDELILDGEDGMITSPPSAFIPTDHAQAPVISDISVDMSTSGLMRGRLATISWKTNTPTQAQFWFGPSPQHAGVPLGKFDISDDFSISVDMLPSSTYFYRILVMDEAGFVTMTDQMSIETPPNLIHALGHPISRTVQFAYRDARCFADAKPIYAGVIGIVAIPVGVIVAWRLLMFVRRLIRTRRSASP